MCRLFPDVEGRDDVDHEVYHILPVVDAWWTGIPDAARTVHDQCNVQHTPCNECCHPTSVHASMKTLSAKLMCRHVINPIVVVVNVEFADKIFIFIYVVILQLRTRGPSSG